MRREFVDALTSLADRDERIFLITGDLGFMALEPFIERHPDRFLNIGASEQQMVASATGLALEGFTPYCYSIATFSTLRPFEFIRNGPVAHGLPVRIVGVGAGFDYGNDGMTHYALEDIAVMRSQPGMTIVAPGDPRQVDTAVAAIQACTGPAYLRLCRHGIKIENFSGSFELGTNAVLKPGAKRWIVALGESVHCGLEALTDPRLEGADVGLMLVTTVAPFDAAGFAETVAGSEAVFVIESHYRNGGLGSLVCETLSEAGSGCRVHRVGIADVPIGITGSGAFMRAHFEADAAALADSLSSAL